MLEGQYRRVRSDANATVLCHRFRVPHAGYKTSYFCVLNADLDRVRIKSVTRHLDDRLWLDPQPDSWFGATYNAQDKRFLGSADRDQIEALTGYRLGPDEDARTWWKEYRKDYQATENQVNRYLRVLARQSSQLSTLLEKLGYNSTDPRLQELTKSTTVALGSLVYSDRVDAEIAHRYRRLYSGASLTFERAYFPLACFALVYLIPRIGRGFSRRGPRWGLKVFAIYGLVVLPYMLGYPHVWIFTFDEQGTILYNAVLSIVHVPVVVMTYFLPWLHHGLSPITTMTETLSIPMLAWINDPNTITLSVPPNTPSRGVSLVMGALFYGGLAALSGWLRDDVVKPVATVESLLADARQSESL